ncbi:phage major capsid protein [Aquicoccus sp. SU-CL01552]|uniref:phage major capsid protein n=1 Tax=Aquicoccus sp. SU-CL01552 TaxID=3127656 RepID=UPI00310B2DCC
MSDFSRQIASLEQVSNAALVPWMSRIKAMGLHHDIESIEGAARRLGAPAELAAKIKAAVGAEVSSDAPGLSGASAAVTAFISQMRTQSVLARIFAERWALRVPFNTRLMSVGMDATAAVVTGGKPIPVTDLDWDDPLIVEREKIAAALVLTKELWADATAAGQGFVNTQMRAAIATACDNFLFAKLTDSGTSDETVTTLGGLPDIDDLRGAMLGALNSVHTRAAGNPVWAVSPTAANMLAMVGDEELNPFSGQVAKIPAVITSGFTGSRMGLVDAAAIGGNLDRLEIVSTDEAVVEMATDPTNDTTTPTGSDSVVSLFQTDSVAMKYVVHLGLEPVRDNSAAFITFDEGGS